MEHPDFGAICECACHRDGCDMMHFDACCEWCGRKYISADGVVDVVRFGALVMEWRLREKGRERKRAEVPPFTRFVFPRVKRTFPGPFPKGEKR